MLEVCTQLIAYMLSHLTAAGMRSDHKHNMPLPCMHALSLRTWCVTFRTAHSGRENQTTRQDVPGRSGSGTKLCTLVAADDAVEDTKLALEGVTPPLPRS